MPKNYEEQIEDWYTRNGVEKPKHDPHMTEAEIRDTFETLRKTTVHGGWKQVGNRITCYKCPTPHGDTIPTEYLLKGTDTNGLPTLAKIS
jgi:hypothetical protein